MALPGDLSDVLGVVFALFTAVEKSFCAYHCNVAEMQLRHTEASCGRTRPTMKGVWKLSASNSGISLLEQQ